MRYLLLTGIASFVLAFLYVYSNVLKGKATGVGAAVPWALQIQTLIAVWGLFCLGHLLWLRFR